MNELEKLIKDESWIVSGDRTFSPEILAAVETVKECIEQKKTREEICYRLNISQDWLGILMRTHGLSFKNKSNVCRQSEDATRQKQIRKCLLDGLSIDEIKSMLGVTFVEIREVKKTLKV